MEADCIAVCCPLCQMNLDLRQKQAGRQAKTRFDMPVLYYTQLMGLAFGCDEKELGLDKLCARPDKVVDKIKALNTAVREAQGGKA